MKKQYSTPIRWVCGCLLICVAIFIAYWWFYKLAPIRHLSDPEWRAAHSARALWEEEQKKYSRLSVSPDLCFAGDMIGYYGDKHWCLWLIGKMHDGSSFRVCGCTETALMFMTNHYAEDWKEWADSHQNKSQTEWIRDGFAKRGINIHYPLTHEDTVLLLKILGQKTWDTLYGGPQGKKSPEAIPGYIQYNAFRWLRDSGFDPTSFMNSNIQLLKSDNVRIGFMQYMKWNVAYPRHDGVGILAFDKKQEDDSWLSPPIIIKPWFQLTAWLLIVIFVFTGTIILCWRNKGVSDKVRFVYYCITTPLRLIGQWIRKHHRLVLAVIFVLVCIFIVIAYIMLPVWMPDWVIKHSSSPERVLRASHFAFNGHFDASPALKKILGNKFENFLLEKLSASDDATKEAAACILAYSKCPLAEKALIKAYLKEQNKELQLSLLFYIGWVATDDSRELLVGILENRIDGSRWSALRSVSMSSINGRYKIISQYLNDSDKSVREEAVSALKNKKKK